MSYGSLYQYLCYFVEPLQALKEMGNFMFI